MTNTAIGLFAIGVAGLGGVALRFQVGLPKLAPLSALNPAISLGAGAATVAAVGVLATGQRRAGAAAIACLSLASIVLIHLPRLWARPSAGGRWGNAFMALAIGCAAICLASRGTDGDFAGRWRRLGVCGFGLALVVFGAIHWIFHADIAELIPGWMPWRTIWPYATGAASICAGLALWLQIIDRLAARLTAVMFAAWIGIIHVPDVLNHAQDAAAWEALWIAVALTGGAFLLSTAPAENARSTNRR